MLAFRVTVSERDEDLATALLWEAGTCGIEVESDPGGRVALLAYFPGEESASADSLRERLPFATVDPAPVPEVDWVARFREAFRPFAVGGFTVVPSWETPPAGSLPLLVDPGRAFGTGTHETTRLCLAALEAAATRGSLGRVLDVGAGTGILGVAALRLGASLAIATDVDPEAVASASVHARLNGVPLHVARADGGRPFRARSFDLVLANLTAPLLVARADELRALVAPGGRLVLSGLLQTDRLEVQAAFEPARGPEVLTEGEWAALVYESPA